MLIAVTGATGFLGRYIVNRLLEAGHRCRCWHRPQSDRGGFVPGDIEWIEGRLNDEDAARALVQGADALVHSALERTEAGWSAATESLIPYLERNFIGSIRLMQRAKAAGAARCVMLSTCAVHDVILPDRKLDEAHPTWARSHYGAHKAAIESFVHSFGFGEGWPVCALRPTGIYGLSHPIEESKWLDLVRKVKRGQPIASAAGGKEVHAADVAKAVEILLHADAGAITGQAFNCYDLYVAVQDIAMIARALTGSSSEIEMLNAGPKNQIDTTKLRALGMAFGGRPLLEKTIAELVSAA